jgi:hypothetical protein
MAFASGSASCDQALKTLKPLKFNFAKIIGSEPKDEMGKEFQEIFGSFIENHRASKENLESLALAIFEKRLALARKYGTNFSKMMKPEDPTGVSKAWELRWNGVSQSTSWSFGTKNHSRAHVIWEVLNQNLKEKPSRLAPVDTSKIKIFSSVKVGSYNQAQVWTFIYTLDGRNLQFKILRFENDHYFIKHADDVDIPLIRKRLNSLWQDSFEQNNSPQKRMKSLAEFEWLWFWTNPFGRSGALLGDALSLIMQKKFIEDGLPISIRTDYEMPDLQALSMPLDQYKKLRSLHQ